ncbi:unnamed protein product [Victoria cruziana]
MAAAVAASGVLLPGPSIVPGSLLMKPNAQLLLSPSSHRTSSKSPPTATGVLVRASQSTPQSKEEKKRKMSLFDTASNLLTNFLSGGSIGSMPTAEGAVSDLFGRPLFFALYDWFIQHGPVYKLAFGPKSFVVISDPVVARHILKENAFSYDKGVLADILEPIMGKGLIPADLGTWRKRRKAISPAFHTMFLEAMVRTFRDCSERSITKLENTFLKNMSGHAIEVDIEAEFSSLALDIIGLGIFNYDFGSVTKESPVIQAVYGTLFEAEHRSTFYIPYWKFPLARWIVPRQRKFQKDLKIINDCLDQLISNAKATREDASLLRFLVDMRGEDVDNVQLRDDLMTMLIAGHETTAAVLTWAVFLLAQVYNLHRSPYFWNNPNEFYPERYLESKESEGIRGWAGFDPKRSPGALYPNEVISDFAFLPFGGGPRKCLGDQFALLESTVALSLLLRKFDVELRGSPESVELVTGATIHTKNGLWCKLKKRPSS